MKPTEVLKEEHHGVKLSLRVLGKLCEKMTAEGSEDALAAEHDLVRLIEFFRVFVDKCHHAKEEEILFPALLAAGLPKQGGPVQVMLHEHELGRKMVSNMDSALTNFRLDKQQALPELKEAAKSYIQLLTDHIDKEDNVLYPFADANLSAAIQADMVAAFEDIETERIGQGRHEQFHEMLHEFHKKYLK